MIALLVIIFVITISMWYSRRKGDIASNEHWRALFRHVADSIIKYFHGCSTRVVLVALKTIGAITGASILYPAVRAAYECDESVGFRKLYLEFQNDAVSWSVQGVAVVAVLIIVVLYLYTNRKNKIAPELIISDLNSIKKTGEENLRATNQLDSKFDEVLNRLDRGSNSESMKRLLPKFKEDVRMLRISSAYGHLSDIYAELERDVKQDLSLQATVQYYLGLCAKYKKEGDCVKHFEKAYSLMHESGELIAEVLDGMIYVSCKLKSEKDAQQYVEELKKINPTDFWIVVPDLVYAYNIDDALSKITRDFNKTLALSNALVIGLKHAQHTFGVDIDTYNYDQLSILTIDNIPLWVLNMDVAMNRFLRNWYMFEDVQQMKNQYVEDLFKISDAYLRETQTKDIVNIVPDIVFLHAFTGYILDQEERWLTVMANERGNVHIKEVYCLAYAIMLRDRHREQEATQVLKEYGDNPPAEILNLRLLLAFRTNNAHEMIEPIRLASEQKVSIQDLYLPNFMTVIYYFFDDVKSYAQSLNIQNPLSRDFVDRYVAYKSNEEVDVNYLQENEQRFSIFLHPYLATIYRDKIGLDAAVDLMEKCVDRKINDFRMGLLLGYYEEDQKYAVKLYHLLQELRSNGVVEHRLLWREMVMSENIQDSANALEVSELLVLHYPADAAALLYHVKILRGLGQIERVKSYENRFYELDLQAKYVRNLVDIYISIGETQFALEYLYRKIKITEDQTLLDYYYIIHLNPEVAKVMFEDQTIVQLGDLTTIKIGDEEKGVEINSGSVYANLEGERVGEDISIEVQGQTQLVTIIASKNKYFRLYLKAQKSILENQSQNIRTFNINDFNFQEDPIGAIKKMVGSPEDAESIEEEKRLNYREGKYSLGNFIREYDEVASAYNLLFDRHFAIYTMSNAFYDQVIPDKNVLANAEFVLDLTSLILLNEIQRRYNKQFATKFVIPKSLQSLLKDVAFKEEQGTPSLIYTAVLEKITVNYVDKEKTALWNITKNLLDWIDRNCEVKIVEEKLKYDNADIKRQIYGLSMDSIILTLQGRVLLTEDWCWPKTMLEKYPSMSVYNWLHITEDAIENDFADNMLDCGNLGYTMTEAYIQSQYELSIANRPNSLSVCMANMEFAPTNYQSMLNVGQTILQKDSVETARSIVIEMFKSVMKTLSPRTAFLLCYKESMTHKSEIYLQCLSDAFNECYPDFLINVQ